MLRASDALIQGSGLKSEIEIYYFFDGKEWTYYNIDSTHFFSGQYPTISLGTMEIKFFLVSSGNYSSYFHKLDVHDFVKNEDGIVDPEDFYVTGGDDYDIINNYYTEMYFYFIDNCKEFIVRERIVVDGEEYKIYCRMSEESFNLIPKEMIE